MSEKEDIYKDLIDQPCNVEEYCEWMSTEGVWGGELELHTLATYMQFNVLIHTNG